MAASISPNIPIGPQFYEELAKPFKEKKRSLMYFYELYTLHLGIVRADIVENNNNNLACNFANNRTEEYFQL